MSATLPFVRPIAAADLDGLLELARGAGSGFTSLPPVREVLAQKIERSLASFAATVTTPGPERYLFVLDAQDGGPIRGCCAIEAACGLEEPFYNYHVGLTVQASAALQVYKRLPTLYLANDLTGSSVLCSLYLHPDARRAGLGALLSKSRFLFMASFATRFADRLIAEMRGVSDADGRSPFWEGLGRHFFAIEYEAAEHIVGRGNKAVIAELMPRHAIYTVLLPAEAQAALGHVHPQTRPALRLLEREGFRYQQYIDIFDGGPVLEAPLHAVRSVRLARSHAVRIDRSSASGIHEGRPVLIANERLAGFRCVCAQLPHAPHQPIVLPAAVADVLQVDDGDTVRAVGA